MLFHIAAGVALVNATSERELLKNIASPEYAETTSSGSESGSDSLVPPVRRYRVWNKVCCCLGYTGIGAGCVLAAMAGDGAFSERQVPDTDVGFSCPYNHVCPSVTVKGETFYNELVEPRATLMFKAGTTEVPMTGAQVQCESPMMWGIYNTHGDIYYRCCGPNASVAQPSTQAEEFLAGNLTDNLTKLDVQSSSLNKGTPITMQIVPATGAAALVGSNSWIRVKTYNGCTKPADCAWTERRLNPTEEDVEDQMTEKEDEEGAESTTRRLRYGRRTYRQFYPNRRRTATATNCDGGYLGYEIIA